MYKAPSSTATKVYCLVRHGEREDEVELGTHVADPFLTATGRSESLETGKAIAALLKEKLDCPIKPKFYSSVALRCLDTAIYLREGFFSNIKGSADQNQETLSEKPHQSEIKPNPTNAEVSESVIYIEEACTERTDDLADFQMSQEMVYFKDRDSMHTLLESHILKQAGALPNTFPKKQALRFNSAFNYKGDNSRHLVNKKMGSHIQKNKLLMAFHSMMVSAQLADKEHNVYIVVSHGQFLNKLFKYLQTQGKQAANAPYNACAILRLDTSKAKKVYDHVNAFTADIWKAGERLIPGQGFIVDKGKLKMEKRSKVEKIEEPTPEVKPTEEVKLTEAVKPTQDVNPTEEVKLTEAVKPTQDVKPTKDVKPAKEVKSTHEVKPAKDVKPAKEVKSTHEVKPAKDVKSTKDLKPNPRFRAPLNLSEPQTSPGTGTGSIGQQIKPEPQVQNPKDLSTTPAMQGPTDTVTQVVISQPNEPLPKAQAAPKQPEDSPKNPSEPETTAAETQTPTETGEPTQHATAAETQSAPHANPTTVTVQTETDATGEKA